jgi:DinB superfamily
MVEKIVNHQSSIQNRPSKIHSNMEDNLRYPIGKFQWGKTYTAEETAKHIETVRKMPKKLKKAVRALSKKQIDQAYRPDGWTARQVVHHLADSHANAFIRFKLALTEDKPVIKPYLEDKWTAMKDETEMSPKPSLSIVKNIHKRWVYVMENMQDAEFDRCYVHPELKKEIALREVLALYDWHCKHHLGHIELILNAEKTDKPEKPAKIKAEKTEKQAPKAKKEPEKVAKPEKSAKKEKIKAEKPEKKAPKAKKEKVAKPEKPAKKEKVKAAEVKIVAPPAALVATPEVVAVVTTETMKPTRVVVRKKIVTK